MEATAFSSGSICSSVSPGIQAGLVLLDCQLQRKLSFLFQRIHLLSMWICICCPKPPGAPVNPDYSVYSFRPSCCWSYGGSSFIMSLVSQAPAQGSLGELQLPPLPPSYRLMAVPTVLVTHKGAWGDAGAETFQGRAPSLHPAGHQKQQSCLFHYHFSKLVPTAAFILIQDKHSRFAVLLLTRSGIIAWALNCDLLEMHSAVEFLRGIQLRG